MSMFTPTEAGSGEKKDFPKIRNGEVGTFTLPARISIICDLGQQERDNFEEDYKEGDPKHEDALKRDKNPATLKEEDGKTLISIPQMPVRQVVVFADLMTEKVDYGETIGSKPYRIMLNKMFMGDISGTALTVMQARDNKGNIIKDSPKTFHARSLLTQLGKACGVNLAKNNNDISLIAGKAFAATIENKETKKGDIFAKFNSATPLMEGMNVPEMEDEPLLISFDTATAEQMQFLWKPVKETIKKSSDYPGSQIEKAMKEWESQQNSNSKSQEEKTGASPSNPDAFDDDVPF